MLRSRIAALLGATALPVAAYAVCTCGFGDGVFTLTTIGVDGDISDWAAVRADLDNNTCDGPSGGATDRDAPVQSTGRDLTHFAFTWDSDSVYLFTERVGSSANVQSFAYYADTDNDALMETGEPVIGVSWRGSNRRVDVYVFTYVALAPGGDPMVDTAGFGDGYTLPGSFANVPAGGNPNRSGPWGSVDGRQMEFAVPWSELGVAPNTPFTFHVSSSNASLGSSSFTAQIDDNLSGCGGGLGSTAVRAVTLTPDRVLASLAGQTAAAVHTLTNLSNADDYFDFSAAPAGDFTPTISFFEDSDSSGTLTAADTLLVDTDGDGYPNTGVLAPSTSLTIIAAYGVPASAAVGESATLVLTAASGNQPLATATATDTISVTPAPSLLVTKDFATISDPVNLGSGPKPIPGSTVEYTITVVNQGAGTVDMDTLELTDAIPNDSCLLLGDIAGNGPVRFDDGSPGSGLSYTFQGLGSATDDLEFSADGGSSYSYTPNPDASGCDPAITHLRIAPSGPFAADTGSGSPQATFAFRVRID